ncbi:MAG TPA: hypothetical protein ENH18_02095 [Nitrospirae bacterium]|nr:hypothetical protein [Nitrospirota bacterium]HEW81141.1 hypothetical protein [Nitrospirota bacterium]
MKKLFILLLKTFCIGSLFVFSIWLLKMLYFSEGGADAPVISTEYNRNEAMIERILKGKEPIPREHFHITDKNLFRLEAEPSICLKCHGIYPHTKDNKILSFLNLHVGFMACEVCHVRKKFKGSNHYFAWVDLETGKRSMKAKGGYGKYDSRIVPVKKVNGRHERLDKLIDENFLNFYSSLEEKQYQTEHREDLMLIHKDNLSEKAVICLDCHKKDGYLNFSALGFSRSRINQLTSSEVSRMVGEYETFYIPRMLRFE